MMTMKFIRVIIIIIQEKFTCLFYRVQRKVLIRYYEYIVSIVFGTKKCRILLGRTRRFYKGFRGHRFGLWSRFSRRNRSSTNRKSFPVRPPPSAGVTLHAMRHLVAALSDCHPKRLQRRRNNLYRTTGSRQTATKIHSPFHRRYLGIQAEQGYEERINVRNEETDDNGTERRSRLTKIRSSAKRLLLPSRWNRTKTRDSFEFVHRSFVTLLTRPRFILSILDACRGNLARS